MHGSQIENCQNYFCKSLKCLVNDKNIDCVTTHTFVIDGKSCCA